MDEVEFWLFEGRLLARLVGSIGAMRFAPQ